MPEIQIGKYRHFKNKFYTVLGVGRHSENPNDLYVVYQALYEGSFPVGQIWIRPLDMFLETVEVDGKSIPRFMKIDDSL